MVAVYLHIPFCRTRCPYCDFVSEAVSGEPPEIYLNALLREISEYPALSRKRMWGLQSDQSPDAAHACSSARCARSPDRAAATTEGPQFPYRRDAEPGTLKSEQDTCCGSDGVVMGADGVRSVFFGGGTPSLLSPRALVRVLDVLRDRFHLTSDAEITLEANPDDVTADLADAWRDVGINRVSLGVQHFDDRVLRYLGRRHNADTARRACAIIAADDAVGEETWLALYRRAEAALVGYDHYEISNYARSGFQCAHNLVYWRNEEYVGFGTGAYSFLNGIRARNHCVTAKYLANPGEKEEWLPLSEREIRVETLIQHFRLRAGLSKTYYRRRFGGDVREDFGPQCDALIRRGLLIEDAESIRPTQTGFALNNEIGLALVE